MTPKRLAEIRKIHTEQDWWISVQLLDELVDALAAAEQRAAAAKADADDWRAIAASLAFEVRLRTEHLLPIQPVSLNAYDKAVAQRPTETTP